MKSGLLTDANDVLFLLNSHHRLSFVSVVFNLNASLSDVAPMSPMPLAINLLRMRKEFIADGCHLCVVSFVLTT